MSETKVPAKEVAEEATKKGGKFMAGAKALGTKAAAHVARNKAAYITGTLGLAGTGTAYAVGRSRGKKAAQSEG